jgi:hypothetical protein
VLRGKRVTCIHWPVDGSCVELIKWDSDRGNKLLVHTNDTARRPTFDTLRNAAAALAWFADRSCTVRTAAAAHHPPTEVLHVLLSRNVVV